MDRKQTIITMAVIVLISTLTQISSDIYTPSLPAIAQHFHTTLGQSQLTMTFFMVGVAITTLIYGPISEGIGRRWTIMIGIVVAIAGTLVCLFSNSIHLLQIGRLIQGCGLGASSALWRSVFRDRFSGKALARVSGYLLNILVLSIIIAPFIGGYFQQYLGWQANFVFLLVWMILVLIILLVLFKETSQHHGKHRLAPTFILKTYMELLFHRTFIAFAAMVFVTYGGLLSWLTAAPVVLIHGAGIRPVTFGYLMIFTGLSTGISGFVNSRLSHTLSLKNILLLGMSLMLLAGIGMLVFYYCFGLHVILIIIPAVCFIFGSTLIFMNSFALAFEHVGHVAGYAGSLYACIQLLGGVLFSAILGHLSTNSPVPMASMFMASGIGAYLAYRIGTKKK